MTTEVPGSMITVEFHCHTEYSKDSLTRLDALLKTCRQRGIDRLVITDHNTIAGARRAKELDPERVIPGEEIMTQAGELLAAFVKEEIPPGLPHLEAIARLREQEAFISVSHPFDVLRKGHWKLRALMEIAPLVDAIETFNARCLWPASNMKAQAFARHHNLRSTVGSDAHHLSEVGNAVLRLPDFEDAESLRAALDQARSSLRLSAPWVHFFSSYAKTRK
jgi:predicted metal-dependent phosphoesterase TrpH